MQMQQDQGAVDYVAKRLHVPLPRLRADLTALLSDLKAELVELINRLGKTIYYNSTIINDLNTANRDYADFINISTNLVGLDDIINDISDPLDNVRTEIEVGLDPPISLFTRKRGTLCFAPFLAGWVIPKD